MTITSGGATAIYICPVCGCPDVVRAEKSIFTPASDLSAKCPACKWEGRVSDLVALVTTERVYDTKAVLSALIFVANKHAAGPIAQALQLFGLVDKGDQDGLDHIMRAATEGLVTQAFMAAAEHAATKSSIAIKPETASVRAEEGRCSMCDRVGPLGALCEYCPCNYPIVPGRTP